jgi:PAS domain S-box-containing protein
MKRIFQIKWFLNITIAKKLYFTIGIMAILIALELATLFFSIYTLSSVRAFVGGEGLWSKSQKNAIYSLEKYVRTKNEQDYKDFQNYMKVPLGDHKTLMELRKEDPDLDIARQGFIEGRNHPDDIDGMIKLLLRFHDISYIEKSISLWTQADQKAGQLILVAEQLHKEMLLGSDNIDKRLKEMDVINQKLTKLEDDFSYTLGEGSRWLENIILKLLFFIALTVELSGLILTISVSRGITKGLNEINRVARKITEGDFHERITVFSKDEIGTVAISINKMTEQVEKYIKTIQESESALKLSEQQLKKSEEKFNKVFHLSPVGITLIDVKTGITIEANEAILKITGFEREEIIGRTSQELEVLSEEDRKKIAAKTLEAGSLRNKEIEFRKKSGEIRTALFSNEIISLPQGDVILSLIYDITDRKKAEIAFKEKSEELARSNQELEQFAYISSHDLQEPLRTISNYTKLFQEEYKGRLDADSDLYLEFINGATSRMQSLILDLLKYSRVGRNKEVSEIDCNKIVQDVLLDMTVALDESKAKVIADRLPMVKGYSDLQSLFQNLITNAIKFRKKDVDPVIHITAQEKHTEWLFSISDNGIGIDKKYYDRIFNVFQRLHTAKEYPGTGIGLALCKKIIELHRGEIWLESVQGKGTTFYFTIPKTISK